MVDINLEAENRNERGRHARNVLARQGRIPAVVYGKETGNMSIAVDSKEIQKIVRNFGTGKIIDLRLKGADSGGMKVLLKDIQYDPVRKELAHVDFQSIKMTEKIKTGVPIKFVGQPVGVQRGGTLQKQLRALEIECLPTAIPDVITADVSDLDIGESIHVDDLTLPEGVQVVNDPAAVVAAVTVLRSIESDESIAEEEAEVPAEKEAAAKAPEENLEAEA